MRPLLCTLAFMAVSSPAWAACDPAPSATACATVCDHDNLQDAVSAAASGALLCIEGDLAQTVEPAGHCGCATDAMRGDVRRPWARPQR